jgi:hypothetical protein
VAIGCEVVGVWGFALMGGAGGNDGNALSRSFPRSDADLLVRGSFPAITILLVSGEGGATGSENDLE